VSKAFTKDDAPEAPLVLRPRPPLPAGVPNFVTARGLGLLRTEAAALEAERARLAADVSDDAERSRRLAVNASRLRELSARIASARVVDPRALPHDEVRFGATATVRARSGPRTGEARRLQIVGVDEADAAAGRVAFTAPIARAILGLRAGETALLRVAQGEEELVVVAIDYDAD
jgi:transcription elongation factor GreB